MTLKEVDNEREGQVNPREPGGKQNRNSAVN